MNYQQAMGQELTASERLAYIIAVCSIGALMLFTGKIISAQDINEPAVEEIVNGTLRIDTPPNDLAIAFSPPSGRDGKERLTFQIVVMDQHGGKYILATKAQVVDDSVKWLERIRMDPVVRRLFLNVLDFKTSNMNRPIVPFGR